MRQFPVGAGPPDLETGMVFITGFDKSGTTWLMRLLDSHPRMVCQASGYFFNFHLPENPFLTFPGGYRIIVDAILKSRWYTDSGNIWLTENAVKAYAANIIHQSMLDFSPDPDQCLVGDKSPLQDCALIREVFPRVPVVAIVRDGRDVAVSYAYHRKRRNHEPHFNSDGSLNGEYLIQIAQAWSVYNDHLNRISKEKDSRFYPVKYEDLLDDPIGALANVCSFIGLKFDTPLLEKIVKNCSFKALSGGRNAGEEDPDSFFRKGVKEDWKNHFKRDDIANFIEQAGHTLEAWEYALEEKFAKTPR